MYIDDIGKIYELTSMTSEAGWEENKDMLTKALLSFIFE